VEAAGSVAEAIALLEADGYRADVSFGDGSVHCRVRGTPHPPVELVVRHTFRFEGDTDPGDEAIVLGVECPACKARGIVVSAFGPEASSEFVELVQHLRR
jgi:hypothetical protein